MSDQLNLFDAKQPALPKASVTPFPTSRRIGLARIVAQNLHQKTQKASDIYWRHTIEKMAAQMREAGISKPVILSELQAFSRLCNTEIHHIQQKGQTA